MCSWRGSRMFAHASRCRSRYFTRMYHIRHWCSCLCPCLVTRFIWSAFKPRPFVCLCVCLSVCLYLSAVGLVASLCVLLFVICFSFFYLSICLSSHTIILTREPVSSYFSVCLSFLPASLHAALPACLSLCLLVCRSARLSVCLPACLLTCT